MRKMARVLAALALACAGLLALAGPASAATGSIPLNNNTAGPANDCPAGGPYWHFVLAPNNGTFSFTSITLNLGTTTRTFSGPEIIPNGTQTDNVFVAVPTGYSLTSLQKSGSSAVYSTSGNRTPNRFNLSSVCATYTGAAVLDTTVSAAPAAQAQVLGATAVRSSGALPYTGSGSTLPLAQIGVALVAAGALVVFFVRRRTPAESEA